MLRGHINISRRKKKNNKYIYISDKCILISKINKTTSEYKMSKFFTVTFLLKTVFMVYKYL